MAIAPLSTYDFVSTVPINSMPSSACHPQDFVSALPVAAASALPVSVASALISATSVPMTSSATACATSPACSACSAGSAPRLSRTPVGKRRRRGEHMHVRPGPHRAQPRTCARGCDGRVHRHDVLTRLCELRRVEICQGRDRAQRHSKGSSEVIRGHQSSSEVIRGHQRHSKGSSEVIRGHQRSSEVIRGHQRSSEVIRGHQRAITPEGNQ
jgi:hypothetical protein